MLVVLKIGASRGAILSISKSFGMYSENPKINYLIKNSAKRTSFAYNSAMDRAKYSPVDELQRRIEKKLRPKYSADRFANLQRFISDMPPAQRYDWLMDMQDRLNGPG